MPGLPRSQSLQQCCRDLAFTIARSGDHGEATINEKKGDMAIKRKGDAPTGVETPTMEMEGISGGYSVAPAQCNGRWEQKDESSDYSGDDDERCEQPA